MNNYTFVQKILIFFSIVVFCLFLLFSIFTLLKNSNSKTAMVLGIIEDNSTIASVYRNNNYENPQFQKYNLNKKVKTIYPVKFFKSNSFLLSSAEEMEFNFKDKDINLIKGKVFLETYEPLVIILNNSKVKVSSNTKLLINSDTKDYFIVKGSIIVEDGREILEGNLAHWIVDNYFITKFTEKDILDNPDYLRLTNFLYNIDLLPKSLDFASPRI